MLKKIVSGGQTGADIAGIDAAMANDFPYGGWIPKGRRTLDGSLDEKYQPKEMPTRGYPKRTAQNVTDSDGTVIFQQGKPWLHLNMKELSHDDAVEMLTSWIEDNGIEVLNVAGKSASSDPEIYELSYKVMNKVIQSL